MPATDNIRNKLSETAPRSDNEQGLYPAIQASAVAQKKLIQPPSVLSSLASQATYKTNISIRNARQTNIECFVNSQVFLDISDHLMANTD